MNDTNTPAPSPATTEGGAVGVIESPSSETPEGALLGTVETALGGSDLVHRYLSSILSAAIVLVGAFVAIPAGAWTLGNPTVGSFIALTVTTIVGFIVPLLPSGWQGAWKLGITIVGGIIASVWPLLVGGHFDVLVLVLAALNALAVQIGVSVRLDNPLLTNKGEIRASGSGTASDPAVITSVE